MDLHHGIRLYIQANHNKSKRIQYRQRYSVNKLFHCVHVHRVHRKRLPVFVLFCFLFAWRFFLAQSGLIVFRYQP